MRRNRLHRRTVLRGSGMGLALPLLEAMSPARVRADQPEKPPVRMACLFFANGAIMDQWRPTGEGADFELSPTLQPLQDLKQDVLVLEGLTQHHARANGDGPGDHARNASAFFDRCPAAQDFRGRHQCWSVD